MLDLLKFSITAKDRTGSAFRSVKSELTGVKGVMAGLSDQAVRLGRNMRNIGTGLSLGVTLPAIGLGKQMVELYDQQVKAEAAVSTAIQSTGGAAGKTLEELKGLASGLQEVTTFGDEDILRNVTAPLLTFTKIHGEVFDEAQSVVLDYATLLKTDLKSASIQVGKALNDPIKGISSLGEAGVQFSESQKGMIESLVETGNVAAAQEIILAELTTQFKEQAKAAAKTPLGQWAQLAGAIGDVKESLGKEIIPFLEPLADTVKTAVKWLDELSPSVKRNIVVVTGLAAVVGPLVAGLGLVVMGAGAVVTAFTGMGALLLASPLILAVATLAGAAYLVQRNWDTVTGWWSGFWSGFTSIAERGMNWLMGTMLAYNPAVIIYDQWDPTVPWFQNLWTGVFHATSKTWSGIKLLLQTSFGMNQLVKPLWEGLGAWFASQHPELTAAFQELWGAVKAEVGSWGGKMIQLGKDTVAGLAAGIRAGAGNAWSAIRDVVSGTNDAGKEEAESHSPSRVFMRLGKDIVDGLAIGLRENAQTALTEAVALTRGVAEEAEKSTSLVTTFRDGVKGVFGSVLSGAQSFRGALANVLGGWANRLLSGGIDQFFDTVWPLARGGVVQQGKLLAYARGGVVSGPTTFPMAGGNVGLMGEAGPEAIMPLSRGPDGRLGVRAAGSRASTGDVININFAPQIDARGADVGDVQRLKVAVAQAHAEFEVRAINAINVARKRRQII